MPNAIFVVRTLHQQPTLRVNFFHLLQNFLLSTSTTLPFFNYLYFLNLPLSLRKNTVIKADLSAIVTINFLG